jgi:hypothetical protein
MAAERFQQVAVFRLVKKHAIPNRGNYLGPICTAPQLVAGLQMRTTRQGITNLVKLRYHSLAFSRHLFQEFDRSTKT